MAEATTELTVTPKQMGKHLRSVRRNKGLSLSEVARGAGLSRRELVAYERGKLPIPENDLWVLAGSCGVDVAELMPSTSSQELVLAGEQATSIGDTVAQLRRNQEDPGIAPYLGTLHKLQALPPGKRIPVKDRELEAIAGALGGTPASIEQKLQEVLHVSPDEAERLRAMIVAPPRGRGKPKALAAADAPVADSPAPAFATEPSAPISESPVVEPVQTLPVAPAAFLDTPLDAATGQNVDVFEELARLPEPLPLGDPAEPVPDLLAPPTGTFTEPLVPEPLVGEPLVAEPLVGEPLVGEPLVGEPLVGEPLVGEPLVGVPAAGPPEGTVELVDGGPETLPASTAFGVAADAPPIDVAMRQGSDRWDWSVAPTAPVEEPAPDLASWDSNGWQPPAPPDGDAETPVGFWEGTDDWSPAEGAPTTDDAPFDDATPVEVSAEPATDSPWASDWEPAPWPPTEPAGPADVNPWVADEWPRALAGDEGPWEHEPDPEAVSTGFYVDWGTPETEMPTDDGTAEAVAETVTPGWSTEPAWDVAPTWDAEPTWVPAPVADVDVAEVAALDIAATEMLDHDEPDPLPPISWRADGPAALPAPEIADAADGPDALEIATAEPEDEPGPAPTVESFVTAGPNWQLGNALPLVEVRGQGALVMRRADERWALADVITPPDFAVEVDLDFRSGPGLGVLFRADIDDEGRMSGYSFDIDPIYNGGGFLVRQWHADRELWNPIARVGSPDPSSMYGSLTVRLVVTGDHLTALVNGIEVLTVESLKQASVDRGREAASGNRVGVQAWSSSDLVIDTLRVAQR